MCGLEYIQENTNGVTTMNNKLTDSEIVKALEERMSKGKWIGRGYLDREDFKILKNALDLTNRLQARVEDLERNDLPRCKDALRRANEMGVELQAENERLKTENKLLIDNDVSNKYPNCVLVKKGRIYTKTLEDYDNLIGDISAEAYKEFARKLESRIMWSPKNHISITAKDVRNLLKELVGED